MYTKYAHILFKFVVFEKIPVFLLNERAKSTTIAKTGFYAK